MTKGRGPGVATVLGLMLVVLASSMIHPLHLVLVPLAVLLVALPPRNVVALAVATILGALVLLWPQGPLWYVERGWALLASGWFVLAVVAWPGASFTTRALAATAAAMATAALLILAFGSWAELNWTIATQYRAAMDAASAVWAGRIADGDQVMALAADVATRLFPALLGIGTVAALGVAWWMYWRLAEEGRPLGRLTEFRFPDVLVWLLIAGLALLMLPGADWVSRVGGNLVLFMSALYALRGLAVLTALVLAMVGTQVPVLLVLVVAGLFLYPIVAAGTLLLGVIDTWLDLRSGRRAVNDEG